MMTKVQHVLSRLVAAVRGPQATGSASAPRGKTGPQMIGGTGLGLLGGPASWAPRLPAGYETYRRMRRDPTIALARALAIAPVVAGNWTVEADADVPQEVRGWIDKQFLTVREPLLETILKHGYVNFGHQGFELVWGLDAQGRQCIVRFKPLLPDITEILLDDHGGLAGLRQRDVELTGVNAMLVSFGGEGSDLHGEPLLENVREVWNDWRKANEVAARYDRKIAGAYLLLHYPSFGQGIDQNGAKLDNVYLAQRILDKLEAASGVAIGDVPSELAPGQDPNQTAWRLEVQGSAGGQQQGFVDRLRYLDSLKVRGMLLPERAILEGQHGTLAESQSQGDLAFLQAELVHHHVTREINRQAVDPVLEANWGPAYRGKVRLKAAPLSSDNQAFLRQLVTQVLSDPKDFADLFHRADWSSIFDAVGLPQSKASSAPPSGSPTMLSQIAQLHREPFEERDGTTRLPSRREWHSMAASPSKDVAAQSEDVHNEDEAADAILMHNFHKDQPRDTDGKWKKEGSNATSSAAKSAKDMLAEGPSPSAGTGSHAETRAAPGSTGDSATPPAKSPALADWDLTPAKYEALKKAGRSLTFGSDSSWFPKPLQDNLKRTLDMVLTSKNPVRTEGVNVNDFYHGHVIIPRDKTTAALHATIREFNAKTEELDAKALGGHHYDPVTKENMKAFAEATQQTEQRATPLLNEALKVDGAAVLYHSFESNTPAGMMPGSSARNIFTPIVGSPRGYNGSESSADQYLDQYCHVLQFAFLVNEKGVVHVTVGSTKNLSRVTGSPQK